MKQIGPFVLTRFNPRVLSSAANRGPTAQRPARLFQPRSQLVCIHATRHANRLLGI